MHRYRQVPTSFHTVQNLRDQTEHYRSSKNSRKWQAVTYLQFQSQVCSSVMVGLSHIVTRIHSQKRNIFIPWPWNLTLALTFELDLNRVKVNQVEGHFVRQLLSEHTDTHTTDCSIGTINWSVNLWEPNTLRLLEKDVVICY